MKLFSRGLLTLALTLALAPRVLANCATDDPDGSKTAAARQQVATDCTCDDATPHGDFVSCAAGVANSRSSLPEADPNFLPRTCKGAVKKCAAKSTCGKPGFVTCCITQDGSTTCKTKKDATSCTDKGGVAGSCSSCCDACPAPGSGASCPAPTGGGVGAACAEQIDCQSGLLCCCNSGVFPCDTTCTEPVGGNCPIIP